MIENVVQKITHVERYLSFEFVPQTGFLRDQMQRIKESEILKRIDAIVCTDSPRAYLKNSPILSSIQLQQALQKPVVCTLSMRDRNSLALQADLIGANEFDVRVFLALTGDPLRLGNQPQAKGVFEGRSSLLIEIIHALNRTCDLQGNALKTPLKPIYPLCVMNSYSRNPDVLKNKMLKKMQDDTLAIVTQPVYDIEVARELLKWLKEFNDANNKKVQLILGFYPIVSYKSAYFLYSKLPGLFVPEMWLEKLQKAQKESKETERKVGVEMSCALFQQLWKEHPMIHFMSSGHLKIAHEILGLNF